MHQDFVSKKWLSAKNYLLALSMVFGVQGSAFAYPEEYCKTFPVGSTFPDSTVINNEDDIAANFAVYGINFEIGSLSDYQMGSNLNEYFDNVPGLDLESNYLFYDNPNGSAYSLGFPAKTFSGKSYKFKMRVYVQAKKNCASSVSEAWANAKFMVRTQNGSQDKDFLEIMAYDLQGNALNGSGNEVVDGKIKPVVIQNSNTRVSLSQVLNMDSVKTSDIICLDVCCYGTLPETSIGLENYKYTVEFAQFECSKVAIDYSYTEYETYCFPSKSTCVGDSVMCHAAGFPINSTYEWYKQNGADWELLENVSGTGDKYIDAAIYVDQVGPVRYKLAVSNILFASTRELEFNVYGVDCHPYPIDSAIYFCGTHFDPTGSNTGKLEQDVVHSFGDFSVEFSKGTCPYMIGNLRNTFGNYMPSVDDTLRGIIGDNYENYFMNISEPNGSVVVFKIPSDPYINENYRFSMRAYIKPSYRMDAEGSFRVRTSHGFVTNDRMSVYLYDDVTGELLGSLKDIDSQTGVAKFRSLMDVARVPMTEDETHVLRMDVVYEGSMPHANDDLSHYTLSPEFAQMDGAIVSIDYMSIEMSIEFPQGTTNGGHSDAENLNSDADSIVNVYSVDGTVLKSSVKLSEALKGLEKGSFYIVGDKKFFVNK